MLLDQMTVVTRERSADLLREAEGERGLAVPRQPRGRQRPFVDRFRSRCSQGVHRLRAFARERPPTLAPCAE